MSDNFNITQEREACLQEHADILKRLDQMKSMVASLNRKKVALRNQGKSTKHVNKELAIAVDQRDHLKARLQEVMEKLRYFKQFRKNNRSLSDYFMEVCERDLDEATFEYLRTEANKLQQLHN
jgi:hypothetical protein